MKPNNILLALLEAALIILFTVVCVATFAPILLELP